MSADQTLPAVDGVQVQAASLGGLRASTFLGVALSLIAGGAAWFGIERIDPVFLVPEEFHVKQLGEPQEKHIRLRIEQGKVDRLNAAVYLTLVGTLLTLALGIAESIGRRSIIPLLIAPPVGALGGCLAGLAGFAAFQLWNKGGLLEGPESVAKVQGAMFAVLGAACGLAVGLAIKSLATAGKTLLAGAVAGALAGILYPVLMSIALPAVGTEHLIPRGSLNRFLWVELAAGLLAAIILAAGHERPKQPTLSSSK
jgi:hypothetical protein